jgi:hypothetical protein
MSDGKHVSKKPVGRPKKKVWLHTTQTPHKCAQFATTSGSGWNPKQTTSTVEMKRLNADNTPIGKRKRKRNPVSETYEKKRHKKSESFRRARKLSSERKKQYGNFLELFSRVNNLHGRHNKHWSRVWRRLNALPELGTSGTMTFSSAKAVIERIASLIFANPDLPWVFLEIGCSTLDWQKYLRLAFTETPVIGIEYQNLERYMFQNKEKLKKAVSTVNEIASISKGETTTVAEFIYCFNCALTGTITKNVENGPLTKEQVVEQNQRQLEKAGQCFTQFLKRNCTLCKNDPRKRKHTCNGCGLNQKDIRSLVFSKAKFATSFWESFDVVDKMEYLKSASKPSSGVIAFFFAHREGIFTLDEALLLLNKHVTVQDEEFVAFGSTVDVELAGQKSEKYKGYFFVRRKYRPVNRRLWADMKERVVKPLNYDSCIRTSTVTEFFGMKNSCIKEVLQAISSHILKSGKWLPYAGSPSSYHCADFVHKLAHEEDKSLEDVVLGIVKSYFQTAEGDYKIKPVRTQDTRGHGGQADHSTFNFDKFRDDIIAHLKDSCEYAAVRSSSKIFKKPIKCSACGIAGDKHYMDMHLLHPESTTCSVDAMYNPSEETELLTLPTVQVEAHNNAFENQNRDVIAAVLKKFIPVVENAINMKKLSPEQQELEYLHRLRAGISKEQIREYLRHDKRFVNVRHVQDNVSFQHEGIPVTLRLQQTSITRDPETRARILKAADLPAISFRGDGSDTIWGDFGPSIIYQLTTELNIPLRAVKIDRGNSCVVCIINVDGGTRVKRSAHPTQTVVSGHISNLNHRPTPNSLIPFALTNAPEDSDESFFMLKTLGKAAAQFQKEVRSKKLKIKCWDESEMVFDDIIYLAGSDQKAQQYLIGHPHSFVKSEKNEPYLQAIHMGRANAYGTTGRGKDSKHMFFSFDPKERSNICETKPKITARDRPTKLTAGTLSEVRSYLKATVGDWDDSTIATEKGRKRWSEKAKKLVKNQGWGLYHVPLMPDIEWAYVLVCSLHYKCTKAVDLVVMALILMNQCDIYMGRIPSKKVPIQSSVMYFLDKLETEPCLKQQFNGFTEKTREWFKNQGGRTILNAAAASGFGKKFTSYLKSVGNMRFIGFQANKILENIPRFVRICEEGIQQGHIFPKMMAKQSKLTAVQVMCKLRTSLVILGVLGLKIRDQVYYMSKTHYRKVEEQNIKRLVRDGKLNKKYLGKFENEDDHNLRLKSHCEEFRKNSKMLEYLQTQLLPEMWRPYDVIATQLAPTLMDDLVENTGYTLGEGVGQALEQLHTVVRAQHAMPMGISGSRNKRILQNLQLTGMYFVRKKGLSHKEEKQKFSTSTTAKSDDIIKEETFPYFRNKNACSCGAVIDVHHCSFCSYGSTYCYCGEECLLIDKDNTCGKCSKLSVAELLAITEESYMILERSKNATGGDNSKFVYTDEMRKNQRKYQVFQKLGILRGLDVRVDLLS